MSIQQYKQSLSASYGGDEAIKVYELIEANKSMLFEMDAKRKINEMLMQNGINFDNKQVDFIENASFRLIV